MDALSLLRADHNRLRGLFARFTAAEESQDTAAMAVLAAHILTELEVHTRIEEEVLYPAVGASGEEPTKPCPRPSRSTTSPRR